MIRARTDTAFARIAAGLIARARALGQARAASRALIARGDSRRWRRAALLWPLFARK